MSRSDNLYFTVKENNNNKNIQDQIKQQQQQKKKKNRGSVMILTYSSLTTKLKLNDGEEMEFWKILC